MYDLSNEPLSFPASHMRAPNMKTMEQSDFIVHSHECPLLCSWKAFADQMSLFHIYYDANRVKHCPSAACCGVFVGHLINPDLRHPDSDAARSEQYRMD